MVEAHVILPEREINRLEEVERNFNQLKKDHASLEEKSDGHKCDHEPCEKRYNKLNKKFEKILYHKNKVDKKKEELKRSRKEESSEEESSEKSEEETSSEKSEEESSEIMREPYKKKKNMKKVINTKKKSAPWYYIGKLND